MARTGKRPPPAAPHPSASPTKRQHLKALDGLTNENSSSQGALAPEPVVEATMPIAIVGLSCKFPGDAANPHKLWQFLREGRSAWSPIPADRFTQGSFYHPQSDNLSTTSVKGAHFMKEDVSLFDASFFNFSADVASVLDPQIRLQLESVYEAIENAGLPLQKIAGSDTSVFAGAFFRDYHDSMMRDPETLPRSLLTGNGAAMMSNRISHFFNLMGSSVTVDTGCSTGLTALHMGVQTLRTGESKMSIIGGSNVMLNPDMFISMSSIGFLGADGRSYAFDHRAHGYGRGEGTATLVLKPLQDALRDGDPIRAVIRESLLNQDGKSVTITSPSQAAQELIIRRTYEAAGLNPLNTTYVEAHGTGTPTGDPIEAGAIGAVFRQNRPANKPLLIGSIKSNVGHLEATSGLASVIKVVLAFENDAIPPSINFEAPNPKIPFEELSMKVPRTLESWPEGQVRRSSLSNFGYGGTNAHVIMDDAARYTGRKKGTSNGFKNGLHDRWRVFILSAKDENASRNMIKLIDDHLQSMEQPEDEDDFLESLAFTLDSRRSFFPWVSAFPAQNLHGLIESLHDLKPAHASKTPRLGFVFNGQGAQWYAMGRELVAAYPIFEQSLKEGDLYLRGLGAPFSLVEELLRDKETSRVNEAIVSIALCCALQMSLVNLLRSWNINPSAVTGHSSGEVAAAYAAGGIDFQDGLAIGYIRGYLTANYLRNCQTRGAMCAVGLGEEEVEPYLAEATSGKVVVACVNSQASVTLSGDMNVIEEIQDNLSGKGIFARKLNTPAAYHSHHMEAIAQDYLQGLNKNLKRKGDLDEVLYSSPVSGHRITSAKALGPSHWVKNMVQPVLFKQSFTNMLLPMTPGAAQSADVIIEIGPHGALAGPIRQILGTPELKGISVSYESCLTRGEDAIKTMQTLASSLLRKGYSVDLDAVNRPRSLSRPQVLSGLPSYPWNHSKGHWHEPRINREHRARKFPPHDLLGSKVLGTNPLAPTWRHFIRPSEIPWVRDHMIQSDMVYPGAGCIIMAIEAMRQISVSEQPILGYNLKSIEITKALVIPDTADGIEVQLALLPVTEKSLDAQGWFEFHVYSIGDESSWEEHCNGLISARTDNNTLVPSQKFAMNPSDYTKRQHPSDLFKSLRSMGINHGPSFQNLVSIHSGRNRCVASFPVANSAILMPAKFERPHLLHPITLDALLQSAYAAVPAAAQRSLAASIPRSIKSMFVSSDLSSTVGHRYQNFSIIQTQNSQGFDVSMATINDGENHSAPLIKIDGLHYQSLGENVPEEQNADAVGVCLKGDWQPDLVFLKPGHFRQSLAREADPSEKASLVDLRRAAYHLIHDTLGALTHSDIDSLDNHHRSLYDWMQTQDQRATRNELDPRSSKWLKTSVGVKQLLFDKVSSTSINGRMLMRVGKSLLAILRREISPMELMLREQLLYTYFEKALRVERVLSQVAQLVKIFAHHNPRANILEIGAGSGACTASVLSALGGGDSGAPLQFSHYAFTDVSVDCFEEAGKKFNAWGDLISYTELDIERSPSEQSFKDSSVDLVVASQVLHKAKNIGKALANIHRLLKPGGRLIMVETTQDTLEAQMIFGTLTEWWQSEEKERALSPHLTSESWHDALRRAGFSGLDVSVADCKDQKHHASSVLMSTAIVPVPATFETPVVIVLGLSKPPHPWLDDLKKSITQATGLRPEVACIDEVQPADKVYIVLADIDEAILVNMKTARFNTIRDFVSGAKGVMWISRGGAIKCEVPERSLHSGLLRTLRHESPIHRYVTLDLDPDSPPWTSTGANAILDIFKTTFNYELDLGPIDFEFAERGSVIHVPRFSNDAVENSIISNTASPIPETLPYHQHGRELKLGIEQPGLLDSLTFRDDPNASVPLPDDFVEIESKAFGLNFRDIMVGMGQMQEKIMGFESSGVITKVGADTSHGFRVGDRVCALISRGGWTTYTRLHWTGVAKIPDETSFEAAASIPMVFVTAYYCFFEVARLCKGESVLIHAGSGGVGQAAIILAKHIGADIFTTTSTEEKKKFLVDTYGISPGHILSSRDPSFSKGIMSATGGRGVDVVLNSLSGQMLQESWNCVTYLGRFVEIGKRDIQANKNLEMENFQKAITFASVDLIQLAAYKRSTLAKVMEQVSQLMAQGIIKPIKPITVYPISELQRAFRTMQAGKHLGKIVIMPHPDDMVKIMPKSISTAAELSSDASYIVVGGLGGIGRSITQMLVERGAKHLVLISRSAATRPSSSAFLKEIRRAGCNVVARNCDIANEADLASLKRSCLGDLPPIRGVIQAAMFLKDAVFEHMTFEQWEGTTGGKIAGSLNLHRQFQELDFFIMLSSLTGIVGNSSQANYTAGGTFQDALAQYRTSKGMPALSIDLGMVKSVGYVAEATGVTERLSKLGYFSLEEDEVLRLIESGIVTPLRHERSCQVVTGLGSFASADDIHWRMDLRFQSLQKVSMSGGGSSGKDGTSFKDSLAQALSWQEVVDLITDAIINKLSQMFMIPTDEFDKTQSLAKYGVDSLVAVELRNWLVSHIQAEMSIFNVLQSTSLAALASMAATKSKLVAATGVVVGT